MGFVIEFAFGRQSISLVTVLKKKRKKNASIKSYTLADSRENMLVIRQDTQSFYSKRCLGILIWFGFYKEVSNAFLNGSPGFVIYKMKKRATVRVYPSYKIIREIELSGFAIVCHQ